MPWLHYPDGASSCVELILMKFAHLSLSLSIQKNNNNKKMRKKKGRKKNIDVENENIQTFAFWEFG